MYARLHCLMCHRFFMVFLHGIRFQLLSVPNKLCVATFEVVFCILNYASIVVQPNRLEVFSPRWLGLFEFQRLKVRLQTRCLLCKFVSTMHSAHAHALRTYSRFQLRRFERFVLLTESSAEELWTHANCLRMFTFRSRTGVFTLCVSVVIPYYFP